MKKIKCIACYTMFGLLTLITNACKKDFLDAIPDRARSIPTTLTDLRALLDNSSIISKLAGYGMPEMSTDDYYVNLNIWAALSRAEQKNMYTWAADIYGNFEGIDDWNAPYQRILYCNLILERLKAVTEPYDVQEFNDIKGSALFIRAWSFWELYNCFGALYDPKTWDTELGIPLRLASDITLPTTRSTVRETLTQIENDMKESVDLLQGLPLVKTRPSKAAALAFLSRFYLFMENYPQAENTASESLSLQSDLLDYASLSTSLNYSFGLFNKEVIFHTNMTIYTILNATRLNVSKELYSLYNEGDLRKSLFFKASGSDFQYKGSYNGSASFFMGLAVNEIWLNKAEALAQQGKLQDAIETFKQFAKFRYNTEQDVPTAKNNLLAYLRDERRRELVFRGIRWMDLKRYNRHSDTQVMLKRSIDGKDYTLEPQSRRYVFPIPNEVIRITGIAQNER
ncbi:RagB/SusD family nutrient uptake outer membrane protein [Sphingobacterium sp. HMA12]|uniref:RagB/SusD family nutrient uptake outer membrane protein n=1 Tax=Sphingobacterium sp. HMA12 TaxID=2050894 RepID=UPI000CE9BD44|nr:RagB/SusD family nutrient uptake outer membrane protein [Sphingobacterium sp. HMA12]